MKGAWRKSRGGRWKRVLPDGGAIYVERAVIPNWWTASRINRWGDSYHRYARDNPSASTAEECMTLADQEWPIDPLP